MKQHYLEKGDKVVILIVVIVAAALAIWLAGKQGQTPDCVQIELAGELYGSYSLSQNQEILVESEYGKNKIVIENGQVSMQEADGPDRYCVAHHAISKAGETIVCLPHKLVVEIKASKMQNDIDTIVE